METYSYHFKDLQISRKIRRKWSWNLQTDLSTVQHYIEDGWYSSDRRSGQGAKNYQTEMATVIPSTKRWTQPCRGRLSRKRPNKKWCLSKNLKTFLNSAIMDIRMFMAFWLKFVLFQIPDFMKGNRKNDDTWHKHHWSSLPPKVINYLFEFNQTDTWYIVHDIFAVGSGKILKGS